jgi:hypothetical protein
MLAKQILGVLLILGLSAFFTTPAMAIDEMQTLTPNAGAVSPSTPASFIQSTPGLQFPTQLVNLYGSNQTGDPITAFYQLNPDGTKTVFAIPAGKYLIITAVQLEALHSETNIPNGAAYLSIHGGSNALYKASVLSG